MQKAKTSSSGTNRMTAPQKLKLLFLIVNRSKAEFYTDFLQSFAVNLQFSSAANGTANTEMLSYLGLTDTDKTVILALIRADRSSEALEQLKEKFRTIKNGKGIAYTVPLTSVIGVATYQFLSNNLKTTGESS